VTASGVNRIAHDGTISEMDISGKLSVFDLNQIPNTDWYYGIVVDEAVAYQSVKRMVTSALCKACSPSSSWRVSPMSPSMVLWPR